MRPNRTIAMATVMILLMFGSVNAEETTQNIVNNLDPSIQSFSVYADIGIVLDAVIFDPNEGYDINYTRVDVHENESLSSPVICYFETPTNITLSVGGTDLENAILFKRLTPLEAANITDGIHIYELNITDDNGQYDTATALHTMKAEPHFVNPDPWGNYIHRQPREPTAADEIIFKVYIVDYNTPPSNLTVKFIWSLFSTVNWNIGFMTYDDVSENWQINLGSYPGGTTIYYYVNASDDLYYNRTPELYDVVTVQMGVTTIEDTYLILYRGWNLISINLETNMTAADFLESPYITSVIRLVSGEFDLSKTGNGNDFNIDYEWGYFMFATKSLLINLTDTAPCSDPLVLEVGWNLYGVSKTKTSDFVTSTSSIDTIVMRNHYGHYKAFKDGYADPFMMTKEYGYFMYSNEAMQWYP